MVVGKPRNEKVALGLQDVIPFGAICAGFGISQNTGWRWISKGKFPPTFKIGRNRFAERRDYENWIKAQKVAA